MRTLHSLSYIIDRRRVHPFTPFRHTSNTQKHHFYSTLDASYVSAASWMFLVAFGVKDLQRFFMGEDDGAFPWVVPCTVD